MFEQDDNFDVQYTIYIIESENFKRYHTILLSTQFPCVTVTCGTYP